MKTTYLLSFALLLGVLAFGQVGCDQLGSGENKASALGVDFSFAQGAPPATITEGGRFQVILDMKNYGSFPVSGTIFLEDGVLSNFGGIGREIVPFDLKIASEEGGQIFPDERQVIFPENGRYSYNNLPSSQKITILAKVEYNYVTDTSEEAYSDKSLICVGTRTSSSCTAPQRKSVNTRTPLSITSIEKESMAEEEGGVGFVVNINLKKLVDGTLGLTSGNSLESDNKIFVNEVSFANQPLQCDDVFNNVFEIRNEKTLRCTGIIGGVGELAVEHPLIVKLSYVVKTEKDIVIDVKSRSTRN